MLVLSKSQAIAKAHTLHTYLTSRGLELPSSDLLNAIAQMSGCNDWNAFCALASEKHINSLLSEGELKSAEDSAEALLRADETGGNGYGKEICIQLASGFWVAMSANEPRDYFRVCDPLGRECVYWTAQEFADDPESILTAMAHYMNRGRNDKMPNPLNPKADKIVVADKSISTIVKHKKAPRSFALAFEEGVAEISISAHTSYKQIFYSYKLHLADADILQALENEMRGAATEEDLELLKDEADSVVIDWGDENEAEGLSTMELRGLKEGPNQTWLLKDGRTLRIYRLVAL